MKAVASSLHAWRLLERQEGVKVPHGLVYSLAVVEAIGRPHGLELVAEEHTEGGVDGADAVFVSVLDSRCMVGTADLFDRLAMPMRWSDRDVGRWPLVWAGGQGLTNPAPYGAIADLIVIGDAEDPLPVLLELWHSHGNTAKFLDEAARVEGVWVPRVHGDCWHSPPVTQSITSDISVTLTNDIVVNHDGRRRIEIARGCRFNCHFCSLGWRAPLRENTAESIVAEIRRSPKLVHLQAGDAESHSGIDQIRAALRDNGGYDSGWTGRLDSLFENPDQTIPGNKRYAFGVEGVSYRLRKAVGKGYLTDERLTNDTIRFFEACAEDTVGRAAWHLIAGLPTETTVEYGDLERVVQRVDEQMRARRMRRRNLSLHWQPFQPLPQTPMQWAGCGGGARRAGSLLRSLTRLSHVGVRHVHGRTDEMARLCTVLSRADERAVEVLERRLGAADAAEVVGVGWGELEVDRPLPWDFVRNWRSKEFLARSWAGVQSRLSQGGR